MTITNLAQAAERSAAEDNARFWRVMDLLSRLSYRGWTRYERREYAHLYRQICGVSLSRAMRRKRLSPRARALRDQVGRHA